MLITYNLAQLHYAICIQVQTKPLGVLRENRFLAILLRVLLKVTRIVSLFHWKDAKINSQLQSSGLLLFLNTCYDSKD